VRSGRRRLGAEILVTRSITRVDGATRHVHVDGGDVVRGRTIILACGVSWRHLEVEGFDRLAGKGIFYGAARSEAANTHGLDIHIIGAGNSAGQAAMFFSAHARSLTILYRGETLERSMSHISSTARHPRNIHVNCAGDRRARRPFCRAIDVRHAATGETTRLESGGVFIFIGTDAGRLTPTGDRARPEGRAHRPRSERRGRGNSMTYPRTRSRASSRAATSDSAPSSASRRHRRGQHGHRLRAYLGGA
jgi:thioredoxin reductase